MRKHFIIISVVSIFILSVGIGSLFIPLRVEKFDKQSVHSLRVYDVHGILLREFLNDQQGRGRWVDLEEIGTSVQLATIAAEDRRFSMHPGIDPYAILRASIQDARAGRFVSGGSTITQQVIRNVFHLPRTFHHKLLEAWYALRLERMMSRTEILEQYLNRAPYGNQLVGIEAASRQYFAKPPRDLSFAESAFLASLPNAPTVLNPYENLSVALSRQRTVLRRMFEQGKITREELERALVQPLHIVPREVTFAAPHAVEMAVSQLKNLDDVGSIGTTIDVVLQQQIESLVRGHLAKLAQKNVTNAAVVVIENRIGEIRALVGSADYFDNAHSGQVNGALSLRQPGSAIKPFTYGLAFEAGYSPSNVVADIPLHIPDDRGDYIPENYDRKYHGPVTLRTALACSYNIPAVRILQMMGKENLLNRLLIAGFSSLNRPAAYYGYGLTLGNGEVSLLDITCAYSALARGGMWNPPVLIRSTKSVTGLESESEDGVPPMQRRVFEKRTAFLLTNILSDPVARRPAFGGAFQFPFPCAVKTGTTKDYRDNWTVGFTTDFTVGVWAGNFDGTPMRGVSGVTGAGQIFSDIMLLLHMPPFGAAPGEWSVPSGLVQREVCPRSGKPPNDNCSTSVLEWFFKERVPSGRCDVHQRYGVPVSSGGVAEQVFEVFPPEFDIWCREQRIPRVPAGAVRLRSGTGKHPHLLRVEKNDLSIISPNDGDVFKIDPVLRIEYQSIRILARLPRGLTNPRLFVNDGEELSYSDTGVWWQLRRGYYRFRLAGVLNHIPVRSKPISVHVE